MFSGQSLLAGKRILVVEDEYFIAQEICDLLDECGAKIVGPASRLKQGIALARETEPLDCAVLDLNLDGESVADVARTLRARKIGFILLTGYDVGGIAEEFSDAPRLIKPFDKEGLCEAVHRQIEASQG
jgi:CheY-like chemotaxis protein